MAITPKSTVVPFVVTGTGTGVRAGPRGRGPPVLDRRLPRLRRRRRGPEPAVLRAGLAELVQPGDRARWSRRTSASPSAPGASRSPVTSTRPSWSAARRATPTSTRSRCARPSRPTPTRRRSPAWSARPSGAARSPSSSSAAAEFDNAWTPAPITVPASGLDGPPTPRARACSCSRVRPVRGASACARSQASVSRAVSASGRMVSPAASEGSRRAPACRRTRGAAATAAGLRPGPRLDAVLGEELRRHPGQRRVGPTPSATGEQVADRPGAGRCRRRCPSYAARRASRARPPGRVRRSPAPRRRGRRRPAPRRPSASRSGQ